MNTIRNKLWTFIMLIVAAVLLMVWLFQIVLLDNYYVRQRANSFKISAAQIAQLFQQKGTSDNEAWQRLDLIVTKTNSIAMIVDPKARQVLRVTNPNMAQSEFLSSLLLPIWEKFASGESFIYIPQRGFRLRTAPLIAVAVGEPFTTDGQRYYLCLMTLLEPLKDTTGLLRQQLTMITLISIGVATLLVFWLSRYISHPVLEITRAANRIAAGDYDTRVMHKADDEIGVLADTMNNMAKKLGENERMQREFIANTSHELKTPISAIRANAELVMDIENQNEAERRQFLQIIVDESIRLNSMLEDILDLSAMESGRQPRREVFDISEMLGDVRDRMRALIEEKDITFTLDTMGERCVSADPQMMFRVFYNLVDNAVKYTPVGGHVTLRAKASETGVRIGITDDGPGIAQEDLTHIWDRFYKADKARSRNGGSSGLGLAIVKSILDAHGFTYGMESEPGTGTLVWIEMTDPVEEKGKSKKEKE